MSGVHARPRVSRTALAICHLAAIIRVIRLPRIRLPRGRDGEPRCGLCGCRYDQQCPHECCDPDTGTLPAAAVAELRGQWDGHLVPPILLDELHRNAAAFASLLPSELDRAAGQAGAEPPPVIAALHGVLGQAAALRRAAAPPLEPLPAPLPNAAAGNWTPRAEPPAAIRADDPRCDTACPTWRAGECDELCDPRLSDGWLPATPQNHGRPALDDSQYIPKLIDWAVNAPLSEVTAR